MSQYSSNPILVEVYRAGVLESFHRGALCLVNEEGNIIFSLGNAGQVCYPRSAMKLLQVLPLIELGGIDAFGFTLEEIALMCGSHNAEPDHLRVLHSILHKIEMPAVALQCGPQFPTSKKDADVLISLGQKPDGQHNNCSGKHAGMLAMCKLMGLSHQNYLEPNHPAQALIKQTCAEMYEYEVSKMVTALDGCSAPIFSVPVYHQAVAYKNLVHPQKFDKKRQLSCSIVREAVSSYPFMIAGSKRYCTDLMRTCAPKIIGKTGAEGIFCIGLSEQKMGLCIKIDDGKMLPQYNVAQSFIEATGMFSNEELAPLKHYAKAELTNFNKWVTGEIRTNEALFDPVRALFN